MYLSLQLGEIPSLFSPVEKFGAPHKAQASDPEIEGLVLTSTLCSRKGTFIHHLGRCWGLILDLEGLPSLVGQWALEEVL
jgi:hypothetical protein